MALVSLKILLFRFDAKQEENTHFSLPSETVYALISLFSLRTANEGLVIIQNKGLVPISVFPEMKLLFPKQYYNVLSPSSYTHISVRDLYISRIGLPILLQEICGLILGKYIDCSQTHECGNRD